MLFGLVPMAVTRFARLRRARDHREASTAIAAL
jgi:hypothetical protein